jgi:small-conductance mechanosensitive channel
MVGFNNITIHYPILLLAARPFKLGDKIRITEDESLIGDVIEISLIYTKIRTIRNELVAIPNQTLLQRQIVNYSGFGILKISVNVSMTYNSNRRLIETLLIDSTKDIEGIISSSFHDMDVFQSTGPNKVDDPHVLLTQFNDYSALYELRAYTNNPNEFLRVESEIRKRIYDSFQKHGLDLTIPQAQVDIDSNNKSKKGRNNNSSSNLEDLR